MKALTPVERAHEIAERWYPLGTPDGTKLAAALTEMIAAAITEAEQAARADMREQAAREAIAHGIKVTPTFESIATPEYETAKRIAAAIRNLPSAEKP